MKGHILYMRLREIKAGEELTVDYNFTYTGDKTTCACGSRRCRGIMEKLTPKLVRELAPRGESSQALFHRSAIGRVCVLAVECGDPDPTGRKVLSVNELFYAWYRNSTSGRMNQRNQAMRLPAPVGCVQAED